MKSLQAILVIFLILSVPFAVTTAFAQDGSEPASTPPDCYRLSNGVLQCGQEPPLLNPDDNACFPGGAMYRPGQPGNGCPDMDHWICGWYLARYHIENPTWAETFMPTHCLPIYQSQLVCITVPNQAVGVAGVVQPPLVICN